MLLYVPSVGAVTSTLTVQVPPPAIVAPEKFIDPSPPVKAGAKTPAPQSVISTFGVEATTIAPGTKGKVSAKATSNKSSF